MSIKKSLATAGSSMALAMMLATVAQSADYVKASSDVITINDGVASSDPAMVATDGIFYLNADDTVTRTGTGPGDAIDIKGAASVLHINGSTLTSSAAYTSDAELAALVRAQSGSTVELDGATLTSTGTGYTRGLFAYESTITSNNSTISSTGTESDGVHAYRGGQITLTGGSVSTTGKTSHGLYSEKQSETDGAAAITAQDVAISTSGNDSLGAFAEEGGIITINGGSITTSGARSSGVVAGYSSHVDVTDTIISTTGSRAYGLYANPAYNPDDDLEGPNGDTASITATNVSIDTQGNWTFGAYARNGGTINIDGGTITTNGERAYGAIAGEGSQLTTSADITTNGYHGHGVQAGDTDTPEGDGGHVTLTGGTITTNGDEAYGLHAYGNGDIDGTATVVTHGDLSFGAFAESDSQITLDGASITTTGNGAIGVLANNDAGTTGGSVTLTNGSVTANDRALFATDGGTITSNGTTLSSTADSGNTIEMGVAQANGESTVTINGGDLTGAGGRVNGLLAVTGGTVTANNANITMSGDRSRGAYAGADDSGASSITISDSTITTDGLLSHGLFAKRESGTTADTMASISATNVNISTDGDGANGVYADVGGTITIDGGTVTTAGNGGIGLHAQNGDDGMTGAGTLNATNVTVTTTGDNAFGAYAEQGGYLIMNGGSVTTSGAGAHGLAVSGGNFPDTEAPLPTSIIEATGVTVTTSAADAAGLAFADGGAIGLENSTVTSAGTGALVNVDQGDAIIALVGSTLSSGNGTAVDISRSGDGAGRMVYAAFTDGSVVTGDIIDTGVKDGGSTQLMLDGSELRGTVRGIDAMEMTNATWSSTGDADVTQLSLSGDNIFNTVADTAVDGTLTGDGTLTKTGTATLTLSGDNSGYAGTTTIDAGTLLLTGSYASNVTIDTDGTLQVGDGGTSGDLTGSAVNNGTLVFNRSDDYDYTGALSGDGSLVKQGDGLLLLSGDYSYTGQTVVEAGSIRLAAALDPETDLVVDGGTFDLSDRSQEVSSLSGAGGTVLLGTTGVLTVNQDVNTEFAGSIAGSGTFNKDGTGSLNLTGTSSFTGTANVNGGRLAVNGTLPGDVVVNDGGTLGGNGTVASITANSGGIVAPGNSIGTLNVTGDVAFTPGSVYQVEVDAVGNSDRINATGAANITGGTVQVIPYDGNYQLSTDYTILTADGGVNGEFDGVESTSIFLNPELAYGDDTVTLTLNRNNVAFSSIATTPNQLGVAAALDASPMTSALFQAASFQNGAGALQAFDALSGELYPSTSTMLIDQARHTNQLALTRLRQASLADDSLAADGTVTQTAGGRTAIWGQAIGSWNKVDSDGNAGQVKQDLLGMIAGIDTHFGAWRVGAAFAHNKGDISVNSRGSTADTKSSTVLVYAGGGWAGLKVNVGASYGWVDVDGDRFVNFPGFSDRTSGKYDGKIASAFGELSYAARFGGFTAEPFAGVNYVHLKTDGFTETGGAAALSVAREKREVTFTTLGLRVGTDMPVGNGAVITPQVSAAWQHGFGDTEADGRHVLGTGAAFGVQGLPIAKDNLALEAGLQASILPGGTLGVSYVGTIANGWNDHGIKLGFSLSF